MKRTDIVSVRRLFSGAALFRPVPSKRGFVWDLPQVAQLVVDLEMNARAALSEIDEEDEEENEASDGEHFYLGPVILGRGDHGAWILHDGQQRLAVISLFLAFARDRIGEAADSQKIDRMLIRRSIATSPEPRLRLAPEDHAWYAHFILPHGATNRLPSTAPLGSPKPLLMAARFMEQNFRNYSQSELAHLVDFVARNTAVSRTMAEDELRAWIPAPIQHPHPHPHASDRIDQTEWRVAAE